MAPVRAAALTALCLAVLAVAPVQTGSGYLGRPLTEVVKTEFFTTFKIGEIRRRVSGEFTQVVFEPPAPASDSVRLMIRTNGEGEVRVVDAAISRVFVEGSSASIARELVRGLLHDAVPPGDEPATAVFIKELAGSTPKSPSPAYQVFAGTRPEMFAVGKRTWVGLANIGEGPARVFRVSIRRAGTPD